MKKWMMVSFSAFVFAALGFSGAFAQSYQLMRINVPFIFTVDNTTMPAGVYVLSESGATGDLLAIRSIDGGSSGIFSTMPAEAKAGEDAVPQLRFHKYGDQYFLSSVWPGARDTGRQLFRSKHEQELIARNGAPGTEVVATMR